MKNNITENNIAILAAFILGIGSGVLICVTFMPDDKNFLILIAIFFAIMVGVLFVICTENKQYNVIYIHFVAFYHIIY